MRKSSAIDSTPLEPDVTPMIDIVFQLLTFFMVTLNFENMKADERVKLPSDMLAKPPIVKPEHELVLNLGFVRSPRGLIQGEARLFYNGEPRTLEEAKPLIEREAQLFKAKDAKSLPEVTVIIRADGKTPNGLVQDVIRHCQDSGFSKFAFKAARPD